MNIKGYSTIACILLVTNLSFILNYAGGTLTVTPEDREVLLGHSTYFNCSTSIHEKDVHWYFYPVGATALMRKHVYSHGKLYYTEEEKYRMENKSRGSFNLLVLSTTLQDAGRYVCEDDEGFGEKHSAELVVLDGYPVCKSPEKPAGFVGQNSCGQQRDKIRLSCKVKYYGNIPPAVVWKKSGDDNPFSEMVTHCGNARSNGYNYTMIVEYILTMNADLSSDGHLYFCETTRSATDQHSCTNATTIKISYAYAFGDSTSLVKNKQGDEIICSANSSEPCNYKWRKYQNGDVLTVSNNHIYKANDPGLYICEAECRLQNNTCNFTAMKVEVSSIETPSKLYLLSLLAIPLLLIVAIIAGICLRIHQVKIMDLTEIYGLAILNDEVYVCRYYSSILEVYDSKNFKFKRNFTVDELVNPAELKACNNGSDAYMFIFDFKESGQDCEIFKVNASGGLKKKWSTNNDWGAIDVTKDCHVLLSVHTGNKVIEYSYEGLELRQIILATANILCPWHCIKFPDLNCYAVSFGTHCLTEHKVCILTVDPNLDIGATVEIDEKNVIKSFGGERGCSEISMNAPIYLAADKQRSIYVVDEHNKRVLVLNSELQYVEELVGKHDVRRPRRLCLDESNDRMLVIEPDRIVVAKLSSIGSRPKPKPTRFVLRPSRLI